MSKVIKLHKGLDIRLQGEPERIIHKQPIPKYVAIKPSDFHGLLPKIAVKEQDAVLAGDVLFFDKNNPEIVFVSPVSGVVSSIVRGERRKLEAVIIKSDEEIVYKTLSVPSLESLDYDSVKTVMLETGLWPTIKQRPYNCLANPSIKPKSIFISAFDTAPLAPDVPYVISEYVKEFQAGVSALSKLTDGNVHLGLYEEERTICPFNACNEVVKHYFTGKHPAGNVGVQIHHIDPINKGDIVWTLQPQDVVMIGKLLLNKKYDAKRVVAITGSIKHALYVKTIQGAQISDCLDNNEVLENKRVISGNVLTGSNVGTQGFLGFYDTQITVIDEVQQAEFLGWIMPGLEKFSMSRTFFSWLMPRKKYALNTGVNGSERAFVFTGVYEKVLPMDIYPMFLLKAISNNEIEKMEALGIYEVVEEDFALCEYVCPSKIEIQALIRQGLDVIKKEYN